MLRKRFLTIIGAALTAYGLLGQATAFAQSARTSAASTPVATAASGPTVSLDESQRLERNFERACPLLFASSQRLRIAEPDQLQRVCRCAVTMSTPDAVLSENKSPEALYAILALNYLACGENLIKRQLRADRIDRLQRAKASDPARAENPPTEKQLSCLVNLDFDLARQSVQSDERVPAATIQARIEGCLRLR